MLELQILNEKLDLLLKKYTALQAENKRLKQTISQQIKSMDSLNAKLEGLEKNMAAVHTDNVMLTTQDKAGMRKQLDTVIGEIDKILTTLND